MTAKLSKKQDDERAEAQPATQKKLKIDKKIGAFTAPIVGESFEKYTDSQTTKRLQKAQRALLQSLKNPLTQATYELIKEGLLTPEALGANAENGGKISMESKCNGLKQRYIVDDQGTVRDKRRENKRVCEPAHIFDVVICAHMMNNKMAYKPLYKHLNEIYSNITRDFVQRVVRCCSNISDATEELINTSKDAKKQVTENTYKNLLPFERAHLEIVNPFDGELIAGKFSHILFWRDYHSRYVWLIPLKNIKFKNLVTIIANFMLNLPHVPLFIESSTLEKQDLFDICENICKAYHLKVGLGNNNSPQFQLNGIEKLKSLLSCYKSLCIADWNMCTLYGSYFYNRAQNPNATGTPNDLLWNSLPHLPKQLLAKQNEILTSASSHNVVKIGDGLIYLEDDSAKQIEDEEEETANMHCEVKALSIKNALQNSPIGTIDTKEKSYDISGEISEPPTSYYKELLSPTRKRRRLATTKKKPNVEVSMVL